MKRSHIGKAVFLFSSLFAIVLFFSSSCKRNEDCDLIITLESDSTGGPVVGATIVVQPDPTSGGNLKIQTQTSSSDGSGVARFTFKLPAMLQVVVTPPLPYAAPNPPLVKLEAGRSVSKLIKIY